MNTNWPLCWFDRSLVRDTISRVEIFSRGTEKTEMCSDALGDIVALFLLQCSYRFILTGFTYVTFHYGICLENYRFRV